MPSGRGPRRYPSPTAEPLVTDDDGPERLNRRAVRVLPVSSAGRVLLLQCVKPDAPDAPFWVTIGGGIEHDESAEQAGVRELWEETGLRAEAAELRGPIGAETVEFTWPPFVIEQTQSYYVIDIPDSDERTAEDTPISFAHLEEVEVATTLGYRWWSLDDLRTTTEHVLSNQRVMIEKALAIPQHGHRS